MPHAACDDERLFCHLSRDSRQKGGTWRKLDNVAPLELLYAELACKARFVILQFAID